MTPFDLIVWAFAAAGAVVILSLAIGLAVVIIRESRRPQQPARPRLRGVNSTRL